MEVETFFYDTYALYEIIAGNPAYERYTHGVAALTTKLNLMELYYGLLSKYDKKTAERYYREFQPYVVDADDETIKKAMEFKLANKDKNLSYTDAVGYAIAQQRKIKFLTGDLQFKNLPGVEYVK